MAGIRRVLFWMHLVGGAVAGLVILVMSITGVLLTYERQIVAYAEQPTIFTGTLESTVAQLEAVPRSVTILRGGQLQLAQQSATRDFFRRMTEVHRWLAASGETRATARAITGAANLVFLFLVMSGLYLWFPRRWTGTALRTITWFKAGARGKARDFNWHNTAGFWACVPLFVITLSGVVMSYPWANDLVYAANGVKTPARAKGKDKASDRVRSVSTANLDALLARAQQQSPDWQSITVQLPTTDDAPVTFHLDSGTGGQPQKRSTLTLARTGDILKYEVFADQDAGRRARSWMRFAHTGEYYGIAGQTIAGMASAAGALLVWTGLALAYRRLRGMLRSRNHAQQPESAERIAA